MAPREGARPNVVGRKIPAGAAAKAVVLELGRNMRGELRTLVVIMQTGSLQFIEPNKGATREASFFPLLLFGALFLKSALRC